MKTEIFWLGTGVWENLLGISSRPRGNDWLEDEMIHFRRSGVDVLVSALERHEVNELELSQEALLCKRHQMGWVSYPIQDRGLPVSMGDFYTQTRAWVEQIEQGQRWVVHCRQGIGRSSLIAAALLCHVEKKPVEQLFLRLASARGREVPDTPEQVAWLSAWAVRFGLLGAY